MKTVFHSGDLGDIIYAMPVFRELGGVNIWLATRDWNKEFTRSRYDTISPLLLGQDYVGEVHYGEPPAPVDYDFSTYRSVGYQRYRTLTDSQAMWAMGKHIQYSPWISKPAGDARAEGRILVHRTPRWRGEWFPWKKLAEKAGERFLSVCSPEEHLDLEEVVGRRIDRVTASDFIELAGLIAGSEIFIGNQSSPMAIAIGMGHPVIQETSLRVPDCYFKGAKITPVTWSLEFDGARLIDDRVLLGTRRTPPGGWQVELNGKVVSANTPGQLEKKGVDFREILLQNTIRVGENHPSFIRLGEFCPFLTLKEMK